MDEVEQSERRSLVAAALATANDNPNAERIRIPWRTSEVLATVVELPVNKVLLNPRSHRIRAQLESSLDRALVDELPFSPEAQSIIEEILREAKEFDGLKANLKDVGQLEPGVVTADGVLVNANTRCVALRDNRARYVRAAVLPSDAVQEEIDRLELRLQMKADFKSDYTFTNELLFIEDLMKVYGLKPDEIAVEMGWASKADVKAIPRKAEQAKRYLRMLGLIRELQDMSRGRLPIIEFDLAFQALLELDDEFERRKTSDYAAAKELRDARLAALLTGAGYRELREIDENFVENYLVAAMEDRPTLRPFVETLTRQEPVATPHPLPGLDLLEGLMPQPVEPRRSAAPILSLLVETVGEDVLQLPTGDGPPIDRNLFRAELLAAVNNAAEDAQFAKEAGDQLSRPLELIRKATKQTRAALDAYLVVASIPEFESERVHAAVLELGAAHQDLLSRLSAEPNP